MIDFHPSHHRCDRENMRRINYRSDFDFILVLLAKTGHEIKEIGIPPFDWEAKFFTGQPRINAKCFKVGCYHGRLRNCYDDNGKIHVVADEHGLGPGVLWCEFTAHIPDGKYPDVSRDTISPRPLNIELVDGYGDVPTDLDADLLLPYVFTDAYDLAVKGGYQGTREEYIKMLAGMGQGGTDLEISSITNQEIDSIFNF